MAYTTTDTKSKPLPKKTAYDHACDAKKREGFYMYDKKVKRAAKPSKVGGINDSGVYSKKDYAI